jgi:hypothetical protein
LPRCCGVERSSPAVFALSNLERALWCQQAT